jgi:hypothetical protein
MGNPPTQQPASQHYVPRFYLKGFTDKEHVLWVYERFKAKRASKPKHEAHRPDYYTHSEHGFRDESAEHELRKMESLAGPVISKLASPLYQMTRERATYLYVFVAFMFVRVPSWREYLDRTFVDTARKIQLARARDKERFHQSCRDMEQDTGKSLGMDIEEFRQFILSGEYEIEQTSKAYSLGTMFTSGLAVMDEFQKFGFEVLYAPEGKFFVTSDSPVYTIKPEGNGQATVGMGFAWPGVEVFFPLNKRACLRMRKGLRPRKILISEGKLEMLNGLIMATATQFLYSNESYRRLSRLFDERGCKVRAGRDAFLIEPPDTHRILFDDRRKR